MSPAGREARAALAALRAAVARLAAESESPAEDRIYQAAELARHLLAVAFDVAAHPSGERSPSWSHIESDLRMMTEALRLARLEDDEEAELNRRQNSQLAPGARTGEFQAIVVEAQLRVHGCQPWSPSSSLLLIPEKLLEKVPPDMMLRSIHGDLVRAADCNRDARGGMLAFGVMRPQHAALLAALEAP